MCARTFLRSQRSVSRRLRVRREEDTRHRSSSSSSPLKHAGRTQISAYSPRTHRVVADGGALQKKKNKIKELNLQLGSARLLVGLMVFIQIFFNAAPPAAPRIVLLLFLLLKAEFLGSEVM